MASGKRGLSDMAESNRLGKDRFLWKSALNVALVVALGATLCVGGTLAYLSTQTNRMLDDIEANEMPKVRLVNSYIDEAGNKVEASNVTYWHREGGTLENGLADDSSGASTAETSSKTTELRLATHTVHVSDSDDGTFKEGQIETDPGQKQKYDNLIVQVKNEGAPAFVRVWVAAPILVDDDPDSGNENDDEFYLEYRKQAPVPEPGTVPKSSDSGDVLNKNMIPFGFNGYVSLTGRDARTIDDQYGKIVYHFAENWEDNWIYVGNSGYLDELSTTADTYVDDWRVVGNNAQDKSNADTGSLDAYIAPTELGSSGGYFVYKHILGTGGVTAPLLTGVSYSDTDVDTKTIDGERRQYPKYNVQVSFACDALTALRDTFEMARDNRFGWGNGYKYKDKHKVWDLARKFDETGETPRTLWVPTAINVVQPFTENEVVYNPDLPTLIPSNSSSSKAKAKINQLPTWYANDLDSWYVVQDALQPGAKNTEGMTLDEVLRASIVTPTS